MNIFNKVALQSMKKNRTRTIVTAIGVVLSTAMITAVITFGISLLNYMANGAAQKYGGWHIEFEDVNSSFVAGQASNDKVASTTTFENIGYAKLDGVKTPNKPYLFIAGFSKKAFDALPITLVSGRLPKTSGGILVSGSISTKGGVQFEVGDTLTLAVGNRMNGNKKLGQSDSYTVKSETFVPQGERTYTVVGICQTPHFEENSAPGYTVITAADTADTVDDLSLFVTLKNPSQVHTLEGTLALKNSKRNKKSYRSIVLSFVLSIVLFISTSAFVTDLKQAPERAEVFTTYDIGFSTQDMDDNKMLQLYDKLKTADGVTESSYQVVMEYLYAVKASDLSDDYWKYAGAHSPDETVNLPMTIQFLDDNTYLKIIKGLDLPVKQYTGKNGKMIAIAKMQGRSNRVEELDQFKDMFKSSSMSFTIAPEINGEPKTEQEQNASITFVDTVLPDTPPMTGTLKQRSYTFIVMAPYSFKEKLAPSDASLDIMVKGMTFESTNSSQTTAKMETMIQGAGITDEYNLLNMDKMLDQNRNMIFIANVFGYTFIIMISLIAVANVFNTISTNIKLRRRELAMLRTVGMSDHDFNKMMRFRSGQIGIINS